VLHWDTESSQKPKLSAQGQLTIVLKAAESRAFSYASALFRDVEMKGVEFKGPFALIFVRFVYLEQISNIIFER
jgi:hypothetical protein